LWRGEILLLVKQSQGLLGTLVGGERGKLGWQRERPLLLRRWRRWLLLVMMLEGLLIPLHASLILLLMLLVLLLPRIAPYSKIPGKEHVWDPCWVWWLRPLIVQLLLLMMLLLLLLCWHWLA
jgi:hypothetical protein